MVMTLPTLAAWLSLSLLFLAADPAVSVMADVHGDPVCRERRLNDGVNKSAEPSQECEAWIGQKCGIGRSFVKPPDPREVGFLNWKLEVGMTVGWSSKDTRGEHNSVFSSSDILEDLEMECWKACMEKIKGCNYVVVNKISFRTCFFFNDCPTGGRIPTADNEFLLQRGNLSLNEYSWITLYRMYSDELNEAYPQSQKKYIMEKYSEKLRPRSEESYQAWFQHVKDLEPASLGKGFGSGLSAGPERERVQIQSLASHPDLAKKLTTTLYECSVHRKVVEDLDLVLAGLDRAAAARNMTARHRVVEPHVPRISGNCTQQGMRMERIFPCFGLSLDLAGGLLPRRLEDDVQITELELLRAEALGLRNTSQHSRNVELWAWLQSATGAEDPFKAVAYAKGVLDATLDCVTRVRAQEEPPSVVARGPDARIGVWRFDFGAVATVDRDPLWPWCANRSLSEVPLSQSFGSGAMIVETPSRFSEYKRDNDTDYLEGYSAVLSIRDDIRRRRG